MELYKIKESIYSILNNDELPDEDIQSQLEYCGIDLHDKLDSILGYYKQRCIEIQAYKDSLKERMNEVRRLEERNDKLKDIVLNTMKEFNLDSLNSKNFVSVKIVNNGGVKPLIIDNIDKSLIPDEFVKIDVYADKSKVREVLEAGEVLDWARLGDRGLNLKIKG